MIIHHCPSLSLIPCCLDDTCLGPNGIWGQGAVLAVALTVPIVEQSAVQLLSRARSYIAL